MEIMSWSSDVISLVTRMILIINKLIVNRQNLNLFSRIKDLEIDSYGRMLIEIKQEK